MSNTKIPNAVDTVNAIRNEASQGYRDAVPVATPRNIQTLAILFWNISLYRMSF